jgi:hypothetical protein
MASAKGIGPREKDREVKSKTMKYSEGYLRTEEPILV